MERSLVLPTALAGAAGVLIGCALAVSYLHGQEHALTSLAAQPPHVATAPLASRESDQDRIISAVRHVEPSVVALNVIVNGTQVVPTDPFAQIFGNGQGIGSMLQHFHTRASGSGFVYAKNGFIVTNAHVVENASNISVVFANGDHIPGHVFASDPVNDLAIVKVDNYAKLPPPLDLGDSSQLAQGQWAIAIGEPLELKQTVTVGVVSGFNRDETIGSDTGGIPREFKGLLQTSAAINPGNSGGPLVNIEGRVIGVNQSTASPQYAQGIGFAIPVNVMKTTIEGLIKNPTGQAGQLSGFLGVQLADIDSNIRSQLNYLGNGAAIASVIGRSPAESAGLEPGDVIQQINSTIIHNSQDVTNLISRLHPGQSVAMIVWSNGAQKHLTVRIGERPSEGP